MPYEIIQHDDYLLIRFSGTLTAADFLSMSSEAEPIEAQRIQVNRILDPSAVESFDFNFEGLLAFTNRRARIVFAQTSKTAVIASRPIEIGLARMFQSLNQNPQIEVRLVGDRAEALDWFAEQ